MPSHLKEGYSVQSKSKDKNSNTTRKDVQIEKAAFSTHVTTLASAQKIVQEQRLLKNKLTEKKFKGVFFNTTAEDPTVKRQEKVLKGMRRFMMNHHGVKKDEDIVMIVLNNNNHVGFQEALEAGKIFDWRNMHQRRHVIYIDQDELALGDAKMFRLSSKLEISDFLPEKHKKR